MHESAKEMGDELAKEKGKRKKKDNIVKTLNKNARRVAKAEGEDGWMGRWRKMVGGV